MSGLKAHPVSQRRFYLATMDLPQHHHDREDSRVYPFARALPYSLHNGSWVNPWTVIPKEDLFSLFTSWLHSYLNFSVSAQRILLIPPSTSFSDYHSFAFSYYERGSRAWLKLSLRRYFRCREPRPKR
jgi:hypothetical protein